ncbi:hypothetical protein CACET_c37840 [Clostridium aceticum]|uniref:Uncharacterized protein n=1 Tax=Clostridium aceticum TaxID=84022 RepID=A0A0D8IAJ4_9CLOT|nr:hypothetical protein [Clostridium aceticum]AKL97212.1 hypothetical protein CACET_c37840 [Clostridium aceticum]KJF26246.1 hypothetical protein TZ02_13765 [Clostridium aceticum]
MKYIRGLTILYAGQFLLFYITVFYLLSQGQVRYFIGQYIIFMIVFNALSKRRSFLLLVAYNLLSIVVFLIVGFIKEWQTVMQVKVIFHHLVFIVNMSMIYGSVYLSKELEEENNALRRKVETLVQYVGNSGLLTKKEFEERSSLIKKSMERRGEAGYEIRLCLRKQDNYAYSATFHTLTNMALETFRSHYDLVGKWDENSFVVLLQNTDKEGMEIAINRYLISVNQKLQLSQGELDVDIQRIDPQKKEVKTA